MPHPDQKGLGLIPEIKAAYDTLVEAEGNTVEHKINLGEKLKLAKDAVGFGKWMAWRQEHIPEISHRSVNVYIDLAKRKEQLGETNSQRAANLVKFGSIREALRETRTPEEKEKAKQRAANTLSGGIEPCSRVKLMSMPPGSPSLRDFLENVAPDEVVAALMDASWETDELQELADLLVAKVQQARPAVKAAEADLIRQPIEKDDLSIPTFLVRTAVN